MLPESLCPPFAENCPNSENVNFEYNRKIRTLGGKIIFEFWRLPPWASQRYTDADGRHFPEAANPPIYAEAMLGYCRAAVEATGAPPDIVGIQNEVEQPVEIWREMGRVLRSALDQHGFENVRIHSYDCGWLQEGTIASRKICEDPVAWDAIDYAAVHMYDYQKFFTDPDGYDAQLREWKDVVGGKPTFLTELAVNFNEWQLRSYRIAFQIAQLYHKVMSIADASVLAYCWMLLNVEQPSYGWTRSLFVPDLENGFVPVPSSHQLRVFGAFSRRLREGMRRIKADSDHEHLLATAYEGPEEQRTLILINRATTTMDVELGTDARFTIIETVDSYRPNTVRAVDGDSVRMVRVEPGQLVTLSNVPLIECEP